VKESEEDGHDDNWVRVRVFNVTFNNISVISLRSVLFVEENGVLGEINRPAVNR
jgi:hypothetical protein